MKHMHPKVGADVWFRNRSNYIILHCDVMHDSPRILKKGQRVDGYYDGFFGGHVHLWRLCVIQTRRWDEIALIAIWSVLTWMNLFIDWLFMQCWDNVYFSTELCAVPPGYFGVHIISLLGSWGGSICVLFVTEKHLFVCHNVLI